MNTTLLDADEEIQQLTESFNELKEYNFWGPQAMIQLYESLNTLSKHRYGVSIEDLKNE